MRILDRNGVDPPAFDVSFRRLASSDSDGESQIGFMMLALLDHLRDRGGDCVVWGHEITMGQLWLIFEARGGCCNPIEIAVDHVDRSPPEEGGYPLMHYRLNYAPPPQHTSSNQQRIEIRTREVHEAAEFILNLVSEYKG